MGTLILGPIVGGLAHDHAHIWGRADGPGTLHTWLGDQPDLRDAHLAAKSMPLEESSGYAGVAVVSGLQPDRRYYYSLTLEDTPPRLRLTNYPSFTTVPIPGTASSFSFAFGSCFRPASPEGGRIFSTIDRMRESEGLRFILLLGDQIYADAYQYNGIKRVACSLQDYRDVYESTWSRPPFRALLQNLPAYMTLDDHEVDDDWRWADARRRQGILPIWDRLERWVHGRPPDECRLSLQRIQAALQAYWEHQGMHSPGLEIPPQLDAFGKYALHPEDPGSLAHSFTFGAAAFFVLDTRTNRISNRQERTMLGEGQWQALKSWLKTVKDAYPVKFLVSSCSLLHPLYFDFPRDRWSGFPDERDRLLHFLAANGIQGVYVLAGDLHSSHAVYAELYGPEGRSLPLWEFCSTPFEQSPNKLARWTYAPLRSGPVRSSKRAFHVGQCNFGVVRVSYEGRKPPAVSFTVYGEQGDVLAKAGSES